MQKNINQRSALDIWLLGIFIFIFGSLFIGLQTDNWFVGYVMEDLTFRYVNLAVGVIVIALSLSQLIIAIVFLVRVVLKQRNEEKYILYLVTAIIGVTIYLIWMILLCIYVFSSFLTNEYLAKADNYARSHGGIGRMNVEEVEKYSKLMENAINNANLSTKMDTGAPVMLSFSLVPFILYIIAWVKIKASFINKSFYGQNPQMANMQMNNPQMWNQQMAQMQMNNPQMWNQQMANMQMNNPQMWNQQMQNPQMNNPQMPNQQNPQMSNRQMNNPQMPSQNPKNIKPKAGNENTSK